MAKYVMLINWTETGIANAKETVDRAGRARQIAEKLGGSMDVVLWTLGRYDIVCIFDLPSDEAAAQLGLQVSAFGTVRTETLRAFTSDEIGQVLGQLG
jgi:uncharacterized protein with GYD domain